MFARALDGGKPVSEFVEGVQFLGEAQRGALATARGLSRENFFEVGILLPRRVGHAIILNQRIGFASLCEKVERTLVNEVLVARKDIYAAISAFTWALAESARALRS